MESFSQDDREGTKTAPMERRPFLTISSAAALAAAGELWTVAGRAYPGESGKTVRMGVVGGGFGAAFSWHEHPNCKVTGVTDLRADRRDGLRKRYACDTAYDSLEIMLKEARDVDAVAVFSGAPDHARHIKMCMERGWHVVSACPTCLTLEEAAMLKEVKEETGLRYMMAETSWYRQECIFARNLFRGGGFGELFYTECEYYHDLVQYYYHDSDFQKPRTDHMAVFGNPDGSRSWRWGYAPMLYPTHSLGYLVGVTGERVREVSCLGWAGNGLELRDHPSRTDNVYQNPFWNQASLMRTDQGHVCRCNVFYVCNAGGERAQWFGDKATLYMPAQGVHGAVENVRGEGARPVAVPQYWKSDMLPDTMRHESGHGGSQTFISAEFVNALVEDREPEIDLYESLAMTVPGIVAQESALKQGEQLPVPQFEPA
ncbi:MAG: Gfo/Idh/MocA family oxidoreductase [Planctomycetota bacterium]